MLSGEDHCVVGSIRKFSLFELAVRGESSVAKDCNQRFVAEIVPPIFVFRGSFRRRKARIIAENQTQIELADIASVLLKPVELQHRLVVAKKNSQRKLLGATPTSTP